MDEASSLRYSYALLGVGFIVILGALLFLGPTETTPHPYDMRVTSAVAPACGSTQYTLPSLNVEGIPKGAQSLVLTVGTEVLYGLPVTGDIPEQTFESVPCNPAPEVTLYATDITLNFIKAPTQAEVLAAINGHVLETATVGE